MVDRVVRTRLDRGRQLLRGGLGEAVADQPRAERRAALGRWILGHRRRVDLLHARGVLAQGEQLHQLAHRVVVGGVGGEPRAQVGLGLLALSGDRLVVPLADSVGLVLLARLLVAGDERLRGLVVDGVRLELREVVAQLQPDGVLARAAAGLRGDGQDDRAHHEPDDGKGHEPLAPRLGQLLGFVEIEVVEIGVAHDAILGHLPRHHGNRLAVGHLPEALDLQ